MRWQEWHEDAPKGQHHLAQGSALGEGRLGKLRPVRAVSFIFIMVLPLQGAITFLTTTQGAALGYEVLPLQGVFLLDGNHELGILEQGRREAHADVVRQTAVGFQRCAAVGTEALLALTEALSERQVGVGTFLDVGHEATLMGTAVIAATEGQGSIGVADVAILQSQQVAVARDEAGDVVVGQAHEVALLIDDFDG